MTKAATCNFFLRGYLFQSTTISVIVCLLSKVAVSQCTILPNAATGISYTYLLPDGTNASGVAYNPNFDIYYAVIAGNAIFPMETFTPAGTPLYQTNAGFDFRGLWWNANTGQLEGNGFATFGLWNSDINANGYALNTGTSVFTGQNQPDAQSCGDYDYDADEVIYYFNGSVYRYSRTTNAFLGSFALTGMPVPLFNINSTSIVYTGCCGNEIALEDFVTRKILFFNKITGAYSGNSQLPNNVATNTSFRFSYANGMAWLYDAYTRTWTSYTVLSGSTGSSAVDLGNDTTICIGSSLELSAGSSSQSYLWSTGSTDPVITIDTAGTYWLTVTNGLCTASDTIIINDSLCAPPIAFSSNDTAVCEKFCVNFSDSSTNDPFSWQWIFEGGNPQTSIAQNPSNICYSLAGTYDVTLITETAAGSDTLVLPDYITVYPTPPAPAISQNDNELTCTFASSYQWQFNTVDITGATNQVYTITQSGLYTVIAYDENGCKNSASISVTLVGIAGVPGNGDLLIFPNPAGPQFYIQLDGAIPGESVTVQMLNPLGQVVFFTEEKTGTTSWEKEINASQLTAGIYFVEIKTGDRFWRRKMVISE